MVQSLRLQHVIIHHLDLDTTLGYARQMLDQFAQLSPADTIGTIDRHGALWFSALHRLGKGLAELLVVSRLGGVAVMLRGVLGVDASHQVMQLGRRQEAIVGVFGRRRGEGIGQRVDQAGPGGAGVTGEDDMRRGVGFDLERLLELGVDVAQGFVGGRVGQVRCMGFPRGLRCPRSALTPTTHDSPDLADLTSSISPCAAPTLASGGGRWDRVDQRSGGGLPWDPPA